MQELLAPAPPCEPGVLSSRRGRSAERLEMEAQRGFATGTGATLTVLIESWPPLPPPRPPLSGAERGGGRDGTLCKSGRSRRDTCRQETEDSGCSGGLGGVDGKKAAAAVGTDGNASSVAAPRGCSSSSSSADYELLCLVGEDGGPVPLGGALPPPDSRQP